MPFRLPGSAFPPVSSARRSSPIRSAVSASLLAFGLAAAQTVDLQGTLRDQYTGAPIEGAEVSLVLLGLRTSTDPAGRFEIRRIPTRLGAEGSNQPLVRLTGGGLAFSNPEPALVTVRIHDVHGRLPARASRASLGAGEWTFHPGRLPQGLYFLSLETPGSRSVVRLPILENAHPEHAAPGFSRAGTAAASALAKPAGAAIDSLRITKAGYVPATEPLLSLNQTSMIARLKDSGSTLSVLTGLTLANATLKPPFQSGQFAYHAAVRESVQTLAIGISAGRAKPNLVLVGNGGTLLSPASPMPLDTGMNSLEIRSTSQDGSTTTTYAIQIHRARDTVSSLRSLRINSFAGTLLPDFQSHILAYKMQIARSASSATLTASWDEPLATVRINGNLQAEAEVGQMIGFPAEQDSIRATVEVTSPDGQHVSAYTVDFLREPPPPPPPTETAGLANVKTSLNATLFPAWSPSITAYRLDVQDTASTLQITYTPNSPEAFIRTGINEWQQGTVVENLPFKGSPLYFNHPVTVRNGTDTTRYTFTISTVLSKDADLRQMTVFPRGAGPSFHPATMREWTLIFGTQDSAVDLKPVTSSQQAKLVYDGKEVPYNSSIRLALQPGDNQFRFSVTSQEGSLTKTYTLNFGRLKPESAVTPPTLAGPDRGFIHTPYAYAFKPSSRTCLKGMTLLSRIEWGDGQWQQQGGDFGLPGPHPFGTHVWGAPGAFTVKAVNFCYNTYLALPGDTSAPILVQIRDTTNGGKVRAVSGPRMASETWSPDTLYKVAGNTLFETGTTLTILPGTTVLFPARPTPYYIAIHGGLSAVGTASDSIRFDGPGSVRIKWQGPLAYNPDGSYKAGPRFEYVTFQNGASPYLDESGGYGFYMKNSRVPLVTAEFSKYARGSYIENCRFGDFANVMLDNSRILNSYFNVLSLNAGGSSTLSVNRCEIRTLNLGSYSPDSLLVRISGNTIGTVNGGWSAVKMRGNNILGNPLGSGALLCYQAMGTSAVNLQDNYWGEAAMAEMIAKGPNQNISVIRDYFDDVAMGKADYSSWKTAPVPDARPDW
jgi:hypothetical protein